MKRRTLLASLLGGALHCQATAAAAWTVTSREPPVALPAGAVLHRFTVSGEDEVDFQVVRFDTSRCSLRIIDQPVKANAVSLGRAMAHTNTIAAVNGGFFTAEFAPLGLVISQGRRAGAWQRSSLLGGVVLVKKGRLMLLWRDEFQDSASITELLQAGPRLVNNGAPVVGLETGRSRPRTFIATDSKGHCLLGIAQYTGLAHLAQILSTTGLVPDFEMERALNFDGGKSTGLWLRTASGETRYAEEISTVRNFVAIVPRG